MNKLLISKDELRTAIIEAVRAGGETKQRALELKEAKIYYKIFVGGLLTFR